VPYLILYIYIKSPLQFFLRNNKKIPYYDYKLKKKNQVGL
jgi:hypothetical protein